MLRGAFKFNLDYWFGYLLFVVAIFFATVGRLFDTGQLLDEQPTGVGMLGFLQHPPLWFFPFLLIATFIVLSSVWYQRSRSLLSEFKREWDALTSRRETLRKVIEAAASAQSEGFVDVEKVVFPKDIVGIRGPLRLYAERAMEQWADERNKSLDIALMLYPLGEDCKLMPLDAHRKFHKARRKVSKFWDRWGKTCFESREMPFTDIPFTLIEGEAPYIVMLTYLEIAHARITRERTPGKQGLFRITEAICKKFSLPVKTKTSSHS